MRWSEWLLGCIRAILSFLEGGEMMRGVTGSEVAVSKRMKKMMGPWGVAGGAQGPTGIPGTQGPPGAQGHPGQGTGPVGNTGTTRDTAEGPPGQWSLRGQEPLRAQGPWHRGSPPRGKGTPRGTGTPWKHIDTRDHCGQRNPGATGTTGGAPRDNRDCQGHRDLWGDGNGRRTSGDTGPAGDTGIPGDQ